MPHALQVVKGKLAAMLTLCKSSALALMLLLLAVLAPTCCLANTDCVTNACTSTYDACDTANDQCSLIPIKDFDEIQDACSTSSDLCQDCYETCFSPSLDGTCVTERSTCNRRNTFGKDLYELTIAHSSCMAGDDTDTCRDCTSLGDDFAEDRNRGVDAAETMAAQCDCRYRYLVITSRTNGYFYDDRVACAEACDTATTVSDDNGYPGNGVGSMRNSCGI